MHDQRDLTQDAVLRAQIATANRLIAQSAAIARARSAIGAGNRKPACTGWRGAECLLMSSAKSIAEQSP